MATPAFHYKRRLHHYETDGDRVCHFANYFRICEEAVMEFLREHGTPLERAEHSFAVVHTRADYLAPIRFGESFTVVVALSQVRRSWLELAVDVVAEDCSPRARLVLKLAAVSRETGESVPLSSEIRTLSANR